MVLKEFKESSKFASGFYKISDLVEHYDVVIEDILHKALEENIAFFGYIQKGKAFSKEKIQPLWDSETVDYERKYGSFSVTFVRCYFAVDSDRLRESLNRGLDYIENDAFMNFNDPENICAVHIFFRLGSYKNYPFFQSFDGKEKIPLRDLFISASSLDKVINDIKRSTTNKTQEKDQIPTKSWGEVKIIFDETGENMIIDIAGKGKKTYNFKDIGFANRKRVPHEPDNQWRLLKMLHKLPSGRLPVSDIRNTAFFDPLKKAIQKINKQLKKIIKIEDNPICYARGQNMYGFKFKVIDKATDKYVLEMKDAISLSRYMDSVDQYNE